MHVHSLLSFQQSSKNDFDAYLALESMVYIADYVTLVTMAETTPLTMVIIFMVTGSFFGKQIFMRNH